MATTQAVKVSRVKLIARLQEALDEQASKVADLQAARRKESIAQKRRYIAQYEEDIRKLEAGEDDWKCSTDSQLEKAIRLLELSDEETVTVRASSDVYRYL